MAKESSSTKHTKDKAASATKASAKNELPTQSNAHEMPNTGKSPSATKSKRSKTAAAPAADPWATPDNNAWRAEDNAPEATKPASKAPSKPASKTASQKAREAPGGWPASASNHDNTGDTEKSDSKKSSSKKSDSKKSNKDEAAAADGDADWNEPAAGVDANWGQPAAGGEETWGQGQQDPTAWQTNPSGGNAAWDGGAKTSGSFNAW